MLLHPNYSDAFLLPPSVEDWVNPDHPAHFVREFVDSLGDLHRFGMNWSTGDVGRSSYSGSMLLQLWLYGYLRRIRSPRKLEEACRESMGAIWLAGMLVPDHNTLWRFWSKNRQLIENLFKHSVRISAKAGQLGMVLHALDGTKLAAACSRRSGLHREDLEKELEKLDEAIAEISQQVQSAHQSESSLWKLELENKQQLRKAMSEAVEQMKANDIKHTLPGEPDAQIMKTSSGTKDFCYNAQVVVDEQSGMIVASQISTSASDNHNLKVMLDEVKDQVGSVAEVTVADSAYGRSEQELYNVEQAGYAVVTARPHEESDPYHRSKFNFNRETNTLTCPRGLELIHKGTSANRGSNTQGRMHNFRCPHWQDCPVREQCCGHNKKGELIARTVQIDIYHESAQRQRNIVTPEGRRALLARRQTIVEPVFSRTKWIDGFTRFTFRGIEKVRTQWKMLNLIANLRILMKIWKDIRPHLNPSTWSDNKCPKVPMETESTSHDLQCRIFIRWSGIISCITKLALQKVRQTTSVRFGTFSVTGVELFAF